MPIYLDLHDLPDGVTAEHVAEMHQADLKIEHKHSCRGITYWCDEKRQTAFCLIEAPNKKAIRELHEEAHGAVPQRIIEVNDTIVESFLGRIEDPAKSQNTRLNIINDPAFRAIMVIELSKNIIDKIEAYQFSLFSQRIHQSISKTLKKHEGRVVKSDNESYLVSFKSVTNAVLCALKIQDKLKYIIPRFEKAHKDVKIGICSGIPVTDKDNLFEDAVICATNMCRNVTEHIVISSEVKDLFESENRNTKIDKDLIRTLQSNEEIFLIQLMEFIEISWNKTNFNVQNFSDKLGFSKSQFYRKLTKITGKAPNVFLRDYKLQKALDLLHKQSGNISEIAYETGFNSPAYFSKCFIEKYGILPSKYIQQHIT